MPVEWSYAREVVRLGGHGPYRIAAEDASRQEATAASILDSLRNQPGIVLADEVGMGKTYVALAVAASVLTSTRGRRPVIVMMPPGLADKWQAEWQQFRSHCCVKGGAGLGPRRLRPPPDRPVPTTGQEVGAPGVDDN